MPGLRGHDNLDKRLLVNRPSAPFGHPAPTVSSAMSDLVRNLCSWWYEFHYSVQH